MVPNDRVDLSLVGMYWAGPFVLRRELQPRDGSRRNLRVAVCRSASLRDRYVPDRFLQVEIFPFLRVAFFGSVAGER